MEGKQIYSYTRADRGSDGDEKKDKHRHTQRNRQKDRKDEQ